MVNALDMATVLNASNADSLAKSGITHVGRYLGDTSWKCINKAEADVIKTSGMHIISIYETNPTQASYFTYNQGKADALAAHGYAMEVVQPKGTTIYFTVDFDAQMTDLPAIGEYFRGIMDNLKDYAVGSYGSHRVILYLQTQRLASHFYQTVAWSTGQRASGLHIYQYQEDVKYQNLSVDYINLEQIEVGSWGSNTVDQLIYVIKSGDTLGSIAAQFKTTAVELEKLNNITTTTNLQIGQVVLLPESTEVSGVPAKPTISSAPSKPSSEWKIFKLVNPQYGLYTVPLTEWKCDSHQYIGWYFVSKETTKDSQGNIWHHLFIGDTDYGWASQPLLQEVSYTWGLTFVDTPSYVHADMSAVFGTITKGSKIAIVDTQPDKYLVVSNNQPQWVPKNIVTQ